MLTGLTGFLTHSYKELEGVIVVGATNFPEALDKWVFGGCGSVWVISSFLLS